MNSNRSSRAGALFHRFRTPPLGYLLGVCTLLLATLTAIILIGIAGGAAAAGPRGFYFRGPDWQGPIVLVEERASLTTADLEARATTFRGEPFSALWSGVLHVERPGTHVFSLASDDGGWLYVDGVLVVDNGGAHPLSGRVGSVSLTAGRHPVTVRYTQLGGDLALVTTVTGPDGKETPLGVALTESRWRVVRWFERVSGALPLMWTLVLAAWPLHWLVTRFTRRVRSASSVGHTALVLTTVIAIAALAVFGIGWGLPAGRAWAPDELLPSEILWAINHRFSGGWHDLYPPAQFYLLGALYAPFAVASRLGAMDLSATVPYTTLFVIGRAASAIMAAVTGAALYLTARELGHSGRTALIAVVVAASTPIFVYYGRLANVDMPYVMWYALALWCYAAIIRRGFSTSRVLALGAVTALSVGTKDQAYAFFVLIAAHLVWLAWRRTSGPWLARLGRVARHRFLALGLIAFVLTFLAIHNVIGNPAGVRGHLDVITGPMSKTYRMFDTSWWGEVMLLVTALQELPWCLGWPALVAALAGLAIVVRRRDAATAALVFVPIVSCYVFFVAVIGYHYDRFFLGPCLGLAILAGVALDALVAHARPRLLGAVLAGAVLVFGVLNGASVPRLMHADSRYLVEKYLAEHVKPGTRVAYTGHAEYLPRIQRFDAFEVAPEGDILTAASIDVLVVSWPYAVRFRSRPGVWKFYEQLESGALPYRLTLRAKAPIRTPLGLFSRLNAEEASRFTNLNKINPEIRVYERTVRPRTAANLQ
jgi:4-amino-4-deoxy-L-arabinose transferase-like glycosyltransferase